MGGDTNTVIDLRKIKLFMKEKVLEELVNFSILAFKMLDHLKLKYPQTPLVDSNAESVLKLKLKDSIIVFERAQLSDKSFVI